MITQNIYSIAFLLMLIIISPTVDAQRQKKDITEDNKKSTDTIFADIKFRSLGPAFMGGRISDIAIHPERESTWYVAVGSGGVWKTENAGTTWKAIFEKQAIYSIGCITIDPNNPHVVWVGTGENVGGRHVGFGDGIYMSSDDGKTWKNMGLKESQHISKIIVHPKNSNILWVAAQGPLWNKGGERGIYKSIDGGKSWKKTLGDDEWTGATDIAIDPRDPDLMYASTWQRHRNVAAYMGGGPGSGIHKSTDGGETWEKLKQGLPKSNMGKIGIAISPQQPDVIYAAIELDRRTGGVFKSKNRGASWKKMSGAVAGGTGPHYYQELYASPHQFDKLYLADVRMQISNNGGKSFTRMNEKYKHVDNHAIGFKSSDPDFLLVGTDGGLYETYDGTKNWRYINNLPITQYYKVAVDDAEPFYNIYGGTQDNNTHGGPSRTAHRHGITNADWYVILFGDGHQPATEPGNPDIVYSEWQEGNLTRTDRRTGEIVYIQPQPEIGEDYERFNWDAPILVSPHNPKRIYFASQRVWKSENRGDSWLAISNDLTKNQERLELPIMGSTQSYDNAWDVYAMSNYNTITSLAESPKQEGLIYAGTDDGLIQITEDGGKIWRKVEAASMPGVPGTAFINDIKADLFDANIVYVALDNHKFGDFKPYLLKSNDKGRSWQSISSNIPEKNLVWRIVQDHVKPELFFLATEFGIYYSLNAGNQWIQLKGGLPTISFRDLAIQKRENDLVAASFGRSFYVLDDYSFLREVTDEKLKREASIYSTRNAWWYIKRPVVGYSEKGSQGNSYFTAKNPEFGATFTYSLKESLKTSKELRKEQEKKTIKEKQNVTFPGWDVVDAEEIERKPKIWLTIKDKDGNVVRKIAGKTKKGFHRTSWNLRYPSPEVIMLDEKPIKDMHDEPSGKMVAPGTYTVSISKDVNGVITELDGPVSFEVEQLQKGSLTGSSPKEVAEFWKQLDDFRKLVSAASIELNNGITRIKAMSKALGRTPVSPGDLDSKMENIYMELMQLDEEIRGSKSRRQLGEKTNPTVGSRFRVASMGTSYSTYGPTITHKRSLEIAEEQYNQIMIKVGAILNKKIPELEKELRDAGAPWIEGQRLPMR